MIRVLVFDFDGTLVNSNALKRGCMETVVAKVDGGNEALAAARAKGGDRYRVFGEVARTLFAHEGEAAVAAHMNGFVAAYTRCCARGIIAAPEQEKARRLLARLRGHGLRIWINSATPHEHLRDLLFRRRLWPLLHGALGGPASKADNLRRIIAAERVAPRQVVMIGDGPDDEQGAREARTWFVAITRERRIAERGPFSMKDVALLQPLLHRLWPRPVRVEVRA